MIDPQQHAENRGLIESILRFVPGFRGYLEKDYRQESDFLARKAMADRLQRSKQALDDYMCKLLDAGRLEPLTSCERAKNRLDGLILKIRGAVRGYSGFFDYVRVDANLLDAVYQYDMSLINDVDALAATIEQLPAKPDPAESAVADVLKQIHEIDHSFDQRSEILSGLRG